MALGKGYRTIAGFKKATTWGTPVACGALNGVEFTKESIEADVKLIEDEQITGSITQREGDKGTETYSGDLESGARYEGLEVITALAFGTAGVPTQQTNRSTADGAGSTGTNTKITSATAAFVAGDVGKRITLAGAGAAGVTLDTTITARDSATQVTIAGTVATTVSGAVLTIYDTAYKHVFKPNNDLEGLFGTLVFAKLSGEEIHEYTTCKVAGFSFSSAPGERATISYKLIPHDLNLNGASGTNNTTTAATITLPANRAFVQFAQMVCRINDQSGAALQASDAVYVSEFSLDYVNDLAKDDFTTQFGDRIDEPTPDSWTKVSGKITFSKYQTSNKQLFADQLAKTRKKMDVKFTGGAVDGVTNFAWNFHFPNVQFGKGTPTVGGPERVGLTLDFMAYRVLTIPTGFPTGYIDPLTMEIVSANGANALA